MLPGEKMSVALTIYCDSDQEVVDAQETLSRVGTGMALTGMHTNLSMITFRPDDDDCVGTGPEDRDGTANGSEQ